MYKNKIRIVTIFLVNIVIVIESVLITGFQGLHTIAPFSITCMLSITFILNKYRKKLKEEDKNTGS